MPTRKNRKTKDSKLRKRRPRRLKKAVPPPDDPLLRHQADETDQETGSVSEREMAELRLKAIEQTRQMANASSTDTPNKTQSGEARDSS
jgi:hypothetical protein